MLISVKKRLVSTMFSLGINCKMFVMKGVPLKDHRYS